MDDSLSSFIIFSFKVDGWFWSTALGNRFPKVDRVLQHHFQPSSTRLCDFLAPPVRKYFELHPNRWPGHKPSNIKDVCKSSCFHLKIHPFCRYVFWGWFWLTHELELMHVFLHLKQVFQIVEGPFTIKRDAKPFSTGCLPQNPWRHRSHRAAQWPHGWR